MDYFEYYESLIIISYFYEAKIFIFTFLHTRKTIDSTEKIIEEEPRYLEEEGFFMPKKPHVSRRSNNIIEERLLKNVEK